MNNDEKEKSQKPNNILRQTMSTKPAYKGKLEKNFSESYGT
jgi:hypothetical protein